MSLTIWHAADTYIQVSGRNNRCCVYDLRCASSPLHVLMHDHVIESYETMGIACAKWFYSAPLLVTGGDDCVVKVWDVSRATEDALVTVLQGHAAPVSAIDVHPDESLVASGGDEAKVCLFSAAGRVGGRLV